MVLDLGPRRARVSQRAGRHVSLERVRERERIESRRQGRVRRVDFAFGARFLVPRGARVGSIVGSAAQPLAAFVRRCDARFVELVCSLEKAACGALFVRALVVCA